MRKEEFEYNGYKATVLIPDNFNGKWVWKTEFFYAFDQAEQQLFSMGYARVYYEISDMYGSNRAIRLMHLFHLYLIEKYGFKNRPYLFGFSRGGLYAYNYALYYPEYVEKIYLDAPVLNLKSWPPRGTEEHSGLLTEYFLNEETFEKYAFSPIDRLKEFVKNNLPVMIVAGDSDEIVPHQENSEIMVNYYREHGLKIEYILKHGCGHHPHSLENTIPIIRFIENKNI